MVAILEEKMKMEKEQNKQEQIGFHKGALATLSKENQELIRLVKVTEELIKAHIKALKELGIDIEAEAKKVQEALKKEQNKNLDEKIG